MAQLHRFELRFDTAIGFAARFFEFGDLLLGRLQRIANRFDQIFDCLFPVAKVTLGLVLLRPELFFSKPQKILTV